MEGISFMLRVRNEETTIEQSIRSLSGIRVPHEIVVVLHRCTDRTEEIVKSIDNPNIRIFYYDEEISRAGYECLATDVSSKHSLATYYTWCKHQTRYCWVFKWDADMVAKPELLEFLHSRTWEQRNEVYQIKTTHSTVSSSEPYLMGCLSHYGKHVFWEVPVYTCSPRIIIVEESFVTCLAESSLIKGYWRDEPWYTTEDSEEATLVRSRMHTLLTEIGEETPGMARNLSADSGPYWFKIMNRNFENINKFC